jgi:hypothetical protein
VPDFNVAVSWYDLTIDDRLDQQIRSSDPGLKRALESEVRQKIDGSAKIFQHTLPEGSLQNLTRVYSEQYVADPCADIDQYFDITNRRLFKRSIPTQLQALLLFGSGKEYQANISALSALGEAVAGFCVERCGYAPQVRPLCVMPDIVFRGLVRDFALVESKATLATSAKKLLDKTLAQFLLDIKTRSTRFRYTYEAFLVCSRFHDGRTVESAILHIDLAHYSSGKRNTSPSPLPSSSAPVLTFSNPQEKLKAIIGLQGETCDAGDEYLTELLSAEASVNATLAVLERGDIHVSPTNVQSHIEEVATKLNLIVPWRKGQALIQPQKGAELERIKEAIRRFEALRPADDGDPKGKAPRDSRD